MNPRRRVSVRAAVSCRAGREELSASPRGRTRRWLAFLGWLAIFFGSLALPAQSEPMALRVVDAESGQPVAGALVTRTVPQATASRADEEGRLRWPVVGETDLVEIAAEGYLSAHLSLGLLPSVSGSGAIRPTVVALRPATGLLGRAVDEAGHGLAGARVSLSALSKSYREESLGDVNTDADGRFALWLDPSQTAHQLRVRAHGRAAFALWLPSGKLGRRFDLGDLVLTRPRSIRGRVGPGADQQVPPGVRASLWPDDPARPSGSRPRRPEALVRGDDKGRFHFDDVAPGRYHLLLEAPRRRLLVVPVAVGATADVEVEPVVLPPAVRLAGRVVDAAGEPLPGVPVEMPGGFDHPSFFDLGDFALLGRSAVTDARGRFVLDGLAPDYSASVRAGYGVSGLTFKLLDLPIEPGMADVTFAVERAATVAGRVVDRAGRPVADAEVHPYRLGEISSHGTISYDEGRNLATTDAEGRFRFDRLKPGTVRFNVVAAAHVTRAQPRITVTAGALVEGFELVVEAVATAPLTITVVDGRGIPVPDAEVRATSEGAAASPMGRQPTVTGGDGRVTVEVAVGRVTAYAESIDDRSSDRRAAIDLAAGGGALTLVLPAPDGHQLVPWRGRVVDDAARGLAGASVTFTGDPGRWVTRSARTGADGRFTAYLEAGTPWGLEVSVPGFVRIEAHDVMASDSETDERLIVLQRGFVIVGQIAGFDARFPGRLSVRASRDELYTPGTVDARGRFRIAGVPAGPVVVHAHRRGLGPAAEVHANLVGEPGERTIDLAFPHGARVSGRVRLQGAPLAYARVGLGRDGDRYGGWFARTDSDGVFRFEDVLPGPAGLSVIGGSVGTLLKRHLTIEGDVDLDLDLEAAWARGRLIDSVSGEPLVGIGVDISETEDQAWHNPDGSITVSSHEFADGTTTDTDGRFVYGPLQAGRWTLRVSPDGYVPQSRTLHIADAEDAEVMLALVPTPGLDLDITTLFGTVPEKVTLLLRPVGDHCGDPVAERGNLRPHGERAVRWPDAPPGIWRLTAWTPLGAVTSQRVAIPGPIAHVVLPAVGRVSVAVTTLQTEGTTAAKMRLLDRDDAPVAVFGASWEREVAISAWKPGHFSARGVAPGSYRVVVTAGDGRRFTSFVTVEDEGTVNLRLD